MSATITSKMIGFGLIPAVLNITVYYSLKILGIIR